MKFKKEDLGLYIAFGLIGGGVGLLAGAILTNWIERRAEERFNAEDAARDESEEEYSNAPERWIGPNEARLREELALKAKKIKEKKEYEVAEEIDLSDEKWERYTKLPEKKEKKKPVIKKSSSGLENRSVYEDDELVDFISEHDPNPFAVQMLYNGTMTMEQVLGVIEQEELAKNQEPFDYAEQYHLDNLEDLDEDGEFSEDELDEMPIDLGIVNDRWQVLTAPPEDYNELTFREIQWDEDDNSFYMLRRGNPILYNIQSSVGHNTWAVIEPYLLKGLTDVYVRDLQKPRYYQFHKLAGLGEDDPANELSENEFNS